VQGHDEYHDDDDDNNNNNNNNNDEDSQGCLVTSKCKMRRAGSNTAVE
jgi:hypothetical protein